ncbi:hypothetical protein ACXYMX_04055 [Sporosarcina sp. CAU 1771]
MYDFVDQRKVVNLSIAIILFIMAFITPAAIIYPIKSGYITKDAIEIGTTSWALLTGGLGITALAFIFIAFAVLENKKTKVFLALTLGILAVLGISFSAKDYYYITPNYFASNGPFTFETKVYEWDEFELVEEQLSKVDGTTFVENVNLQMKNGDQVNLSGNTMQRMSRTIISKVTDAGGQYIRTPVKP